MKQKAKYTIGDIFEIVLNDEKLAIGVILRADFKGSVLGYFFVFNNNKLFNKGQIVFDKNKIAFKCKFGDLGLIKGIWPIIGHIDDNHEIFKLPVKGFYRFDDEDDKYYISQYDKNLEFVNEKKVLKVNDFNDYIEDSLYGYGLVEKVLLKISN